MNALAASQSGPDAGRRDRVHVRPRGHFSERIDAATADLKEGYWDIKEHGSRARAASRKNSTSYLLSTYLTRERVQDALGSEIAVSFWELPGLIEVAEKAGLSAARLRMQYELLLSRPLLCMAMVILAATVSLRSFRSGGIQTMVIAGMVGGFGFFLLAEVRARSAWPVWCRLGRRCGCRWCLALLVSLTVLLHQEDG